MDQVVDVAIVGYGPTGATLANLLGAHGVSVAVIERESDLLDLPRAVHFDDEVMRLLDTMGLAQGFAQQCRPSGGMRYLNPAGELMLERAPAREPGPQGWHTNYLFHQPDFERLLRRGVARYPTVRVHAATEVESVQQDDSGATLVLNDLPTSRRHPLRARWVVGCDGARSLVRQVMGAMHDDLGLHQPWLVVDVTLLRDVPTLPEQTVQYCDPARPVTFVKVTGQRRRWEIMLMPGDEAARMTEPATVLALIAPWVQPGDVRIDRGAVYTFHSLVATHWREGRLLIAGDAAHQTPPFLGQGMCAGVRDAANLGWKLARVVKGESPAALLDSYFAEREPHARVFIESAMRLGGIIQTTDPLIAAERDRRFRQGGPQAIVNLSPALGPGLHAGPAPAGSLSPQPLLADGRRLDAAVGGERFALVARPEVLGAVEAPRDVATVCADGAVADWLASLGARAVLLRPDRYVYGTAADAGGARAMLASLRDGLQARMAAAA
jgi:3-(3-hydroxy-phenyl)propionate hydroxylase